MNEAPAITKPNKATNSKTLVVTKPNKELNRHLKRRCTTFFQYW
jgi:hypothetical protein